ncbi:MAG: hypothetical protein ACYC6A_22070 [Armatimonadota bacterium]
MMRRHHGHYEFKVGVLTFIVLLAIVMWIFGPIIAKQHEKERRTNCLRNQRKISVALLSYVQDHGGVFPGKPGMTDENAWRKAVLPYLKEAQGDFWHCRNAYMDGSERTPTNYGMNAALSDVALSRLKAPAQTLLLMDATGPLVRSQADVSKRHRDGIIVTFADGTARYLDGDIPVDLTVQR